MMKKKIYLSCPAEKRAELNAKAKVLFSDHVLVPKVTQQTFMLMIIMSVPVLGRIWH